jgi:hypothetical protein
MTDNETKMLRLINLCQGGNKYDMAYGLNIPMQDALAAIDGLIAAGRVGYEVKIHQGGSRKTMVHPMGVNITNL